MHRSGWRCGGIVMMALASMLAGRLSAQVGTGAISGRVVAERTGEPLVGAVVEIREAGVRVAAGEGGEFRVDGLKPGRYTVEVKLLGRTERTERVEVGIGATSLGSLQLEVAPIALEAVSAKLERTELVGRRLSRVPGSAHVLTEERLAGQKLLFDDLHALLRQVPGVNVAEEEGHGRRPNIGMRGTGVDRSSKVAVMEDGVLAAPAPYAAPAAYFFPVVGRMEAIEVRKGSSQVKHGPWTTGGALNLVSSSIPTGLGGTVELAGGPEATGKVRAKVGATHGSFGWLVETYQLRTDGFKRLDSGGDTGFDLEDYLLKLRLTAGASTRWYQDVELKLGRTDEASRETYLGLADVDFARTPLRRYAGSQLDRLDTEHRQYQVRHFVRMGGSIDMTTTVYRNEFERNWYKLDRVGGRSLPTVLSDPEANAQQLSVLQGANSAADALLIRANQRSYVAEGVQTVLGLQLGVAGVAQTIELGARYHRDAEDRFQHDDGYRMLDGRMELTTAGAPGSQDNRVGDARALALFLENRMTVGAWTVTPGVRYETIDFTRTDYALADAARATPTNVAENGVDVWVPGIGVTRRIGTYGAVFGGVHRGFGPPGPGADARAKPELSVNYELGARWNTPTWNAQFAGFYNDYTNILGRATLSSGEASTGELFNGGAVVVQGLETAAEIDAAAGRGWGVRVPLRAAYTLTDGRFQSSFASSFAEWGTVTDGDDLPYLPRHQFSAGTGVESQTWRLEATLASGSAMRTRAGSGALEPRFSTDAYTVLNVTGEYAVASWTRVFAGVQNVTDASYIVARRPAGVRPGLPRTVTAGLRATLR